MPSVSRAQRHAIAAAEHGANFPMARKIRSSMTHKQMHDFASTSEKNLPAHKKKHPLHEYRRGNGIN